MSAALSQRFRLGDLVLAAFVIAITALLLVPLPTWLLDILLSLNLCLSLLLLLVGLYTPNALALLAFPSLLLLTTLFRLSLNVASTRLILTQADAGRVIETFGTFLIRGEIAVGIIIFLIITIVNFIVISRGASRVSEVAARFALDSMPGKQGAIDSDFRSGSISREEAERRREQLRKESQLYGSMDGAMKFVQGDAIAGFFIIMTNIIGGLYVGVGAGMSFSDALGTYTVLTVGDGLVSQIPALLISICAGIVVTRVSSGENTTLGSDVGAQLFNKPAAVIFSGLLLLSVGVLPGLPHLAFISVGMLFVIAGSMMRRSPALAGVPHAALQQLEYNPKSMRLLESGAAQDEDLSGTQSLQINLDAQVLHRIFSSDAEHYRVFWRNLQRDFYDFSGMRLPELKVGSDLRLPACNYTVLHRNVPCERGKVLLDSCLVEMHAECAAQLGLPVLLEDQHPLYGSKVFWATQSSALRRICKAAGIQTFDFFEFIGLRACRFFLRHPEELIGIDQTHELLKEFETRSPGFIAEALGQNFLPIPRLTEVLQSAVRDGVSLRDSRQIIEAVASYCSLNSVTLADQENFDLADLLMHIRTSCRRQILARLVSEDDRLKVFVLSTELESVFEDSELSQGPNPRLGLAPEVFQAVRKSLSELIDQHQRRGVGAASVLCRPDIRPKVANFIFANDENLSTLSFDELDSKILVENIGLWSV